jgi:hypothetical protein
MKTQQRHAIAPSLVAIGVMPWPSGHDFTGGDVWRQHTLSSSERDRLDNLMGLALLDQNVLDRLLVKRDPALLDAFDLSEDTRHRLAAVQVGSLKEFAQAIVAATSSYHDRAA